MPRAARKAADLTAGLRMLPQADRPKLQVAHRQTPGWRVSGAPTQDAQESVERESGELESAALEWFAAASFEAPSQAFQRGSRHYTWSIVHARRPPAPSQDQRDIQSSTAGNSRSFLVSTLV